MNSDVADLLEEFGGGCPTLAICWRHLKKDDECPQSCDGDDDTVDSINPA